MMGQRQWDLRAIISDAEVGIFGDIDGGKETAGRGFSGKRFLTYSLLEYTVYTDFSSVTFPYDFPIQMQFISQENSVINVNWMLTDCAEFSGSRDTPCSTEGGPTTVLSRAPPWPAAYLNSSRITEGRSTCDGKIPPSVAACDVQAAP